VHKIVDSRWVALYRQPWDMTIEADVNETRSKRDSARKRFVFNFFMFYRIVYGESYTACLNLALDLKYLPALRFVYLFRTVFTP